MTADYVERYPVLTFASGPTNSMRGAAFLSGVSEAVVLDVGGTTTDGGALVHGFPREASFEVEVGGVRTNFRMPDVVSIGIGGGSLVTDAGAAVGPRSVGYRLPEQARVFGGDTLTLTDVAVRLGRLELGDPALVRDLELAVAERAMGYATAQLEQLVDALKTSPEPVTVILVGGGALLFDDRLEGASQVIRPEHAGVANALGAAISQVSGEQDRVFPMEGRSRLDVLDEAKAEAARLAREAGADPATIEIVEIDEIPLAYLPSNALRLRVKAVGDLLEG
jgi:N-methylhydantoinase A/oxoprolinase/acetone carboxylase beta subunit